MALTIAGTSRKSFTLQESMRIEEVIDEQPNTMALTVRSRVSGGAAWTPGKGEEIIVGIGNITNRLFAGHILTRRAKMAHDRDGYINYELDCVDYTWSLGHLVVWGQKFDSIAASTIVQTLITTYATARGFTAAWVQPNLATVDFQSNHGETLPQALSRLAKMIGGYWYVDYNKGIHFYTGSEPDGNTVTLTAASPFWDLDYDDDLSQARTRDWVIGGSSTTTAVVASSATSVPVDDTRLFGASGGYAAVGGNLITYTGKSTTQGPGNLTGIPSSSTGSLLYNVAQGETVVVVERRTDATGQTALAAILGGGHDGLVEYVLENGNYGSGAAQSAGDADLALCPGSGEKRITYKTRDQFTRTGKTVPVSLTTPIAISASFLIQKVTLTDFELTRIKFPTREVEAGVSKRDLFDLMRQLN